MFTYKSMIVTPSPKESSINEMACYLYPCGFLFGTNIIISRNIFYLVLCNPPTPVVPNIDSTTTYNVLPDTSEPNFYLKDELCLECKKF